MHHRFFRVASAGTLAAIVAACSEVKQPVAPATDRFSQLSLDLVGSGGFKFEPLAASAVCTPGGNPNAPFIVPAGYTQRVVASEPAVPDAIDMNTQNETGPFAGRFLYREAEGSNPTLTVTDLETGVTKVVAFRPDWESMDPIVWTPWGTILIGEEAGVARRKDPQYPQAIGGLMYEVFLNQNDPTTADSVVARPALGAKAHEGTQIDARGNVYGISENNPGFIFRFVPDRRGDLSSGQLYALRITQPTGDRTGEAEWVPLPRAAVQIDANAAAVAAGATGYNRPEDLELSKGSGSSHDGANTLYVAITGRAAPVDNRVIAIDLREPQGGSDHATAFVYDYVRVGLNAPADFEMPDNLALSKSGDLYIAEDPGGSSPTKRKGDDIWMATPGKGSRVPAASVVRFATLTDCDAEPTGIYFDIRGWGLFVNAQHRGGDGLDKAVLILPPR
jgi:hypothetical protein